MSGSSDIDLEDMLLVLNPFIENQVEGSKEREALKIAQAALLYIHEGDKKDDFVRYYEKFSKKSFTVEVSHEFATREEADRWLASGQAQHAEHIKIAGKGFLVVQLPGRMTLIDRPLPEELETDEWKDDSEPDDSEP
jgi:hypothetical protein